MNAPADNPAVLNLLLLHRLSDLVERGESIAGDDLVELGKILKRILANDAALKGAISDEACRPGERSPLDQARRALRNGFLRECAAKFYSMRDQYNFRHERYSVDTPVSYQAMMIARDLSRYFTSGWLNDREAENCPERHRGTATFYFWRALRLVPRAIGSKQIESILMETS
jgi:hypothetical protein